MTITLTADQQAAYNQFTAFMMDPSESVFVLSGFSGTGKSTLVCHLLEALPKLIKTLELVDPTGDRVYRTQLTATTNKAAETFERITGQQVSTIHSFLKLRVRNDFRTGKTSIAPAKDAYPVQDLILFIDEASYIDRELLQYIFQLTHNCKIIFIGDPAQIAPINSRNTPVFEANFNGAQLREVVRQAEGNPIIELSTNFRKTVETGEWFSFVPDGHHVQHLDRPSFEDKILQSMSDLNWTYTKSKVLAWTNKCVIAYNHAIRDALQGQPEFQVGDYAICNSFVSDRYRQIKTDQLVYISDISDMSESHDVPGRYYELDHQGTFFMPYHLADKNRALKELRAAEKYATVANIENTWIDLRAAYAQTINKSQGSTYDEVFIDLDDVKKCRNPNQLARMLYVACSRARHHVYLTGDLV